MSIRVVALLALALSALSRYQVDEIDKKLKLITDNGTIKDIIPLNGINQNVVNKAPSGTDANFVLLSFEHEIVDNDSVKLEYFFTYYSLNKKDDIYSPDNKLKIFTIGSSESNFSLFKQDKSNNVKRIFNYDIAPVEDKSSFDYNKVEVLMRAGNPVAFVFHNILDLTSSHKATQNLMLKIADAICEKKKGHKFLNDEGSSLMHIFYTEEKITINENQLAKESEVKKAYPKNKQRDCCVSGKDCSYGKSIEIAAMKQLKTEESVSVANEHGVPVEQKNSENPNLAIGNKDNQMILI